MEKINIKIDLESYIKNLDNSFEIMFYLSFKYSIFCYLSTQAFNNASVLFLKSEKIIKSILTI